MSYLTWNCKVITLQTLSRMFRRVSRKFIFHSTTHFPHVKCCKPAISSSLQFRLLQLRTVMQRIFERILLISFGLNQHQRSSIRNAFQEQVLYGTWSQKDASAITTISNASCLKLTVIIHCYPHNVHFFHPPLTLNLQGHSVTFCFERLLVLILC